jgi:predicted naringenin-chalcone synthase
MDVSTSHQNSTFLDSDELFAGIVSQTTRSATDGDVSNRRTIGRSALKNSPVVGTFLSGLGTAVPPQSISQSRAAELSADLVFGDNSKALSVLYRRSGVKFRQSVILEEVQGELSAAAFYPPARDEDDRGPTTARRMERYAVEAPVLGAVAARKALQQADLTPQEVTHLITVSCSGFSAPGLDLQLVHELGLPATVSRTHVGFMGCHGLLNGLRVASAFAASDPGNVCLISAVELCSLHQRYTKEPQQIVANALFSDGAASMIVQAHSEGTAGWGLRGQRSLVIPGTTDMMSWRIGDHGFEMTLSPLVPDVIRKSLNPWLTSWLAEFGLDVSDVTAWAIHPGGPKILTATAEAAGFDPALLQPSFDILERFGNMSSPTVAFILEHLQLSGVEPPCVMLAFGPGLTVEAALWG